MKFIMTGNAHTCCFYVCGANCAYLLTLWVEKREFMYSHCNKLE